MFGPVIHRVLLAAEDGQLASRAKSEIRTTNPYSAMGALAVFLVGRPMQLAMLQRAVGIPAARTNDGGGFAKAQAAFINGLV